MTMSNRIPMIIRRTLTAALIVQTVLPAGFTTMTERTWADETVAVNLELIATVPDHLDVAKYEQLHRAARAVSDPARAEANRLLAIFQVRQSDSDQARASLESKRAALLAAQSRVAELEASSTGLRAQLSALASEADRLRGAIHANNVILSNLNRSLQSLRQQIPAAEADVNARRVAYDGMLVEIRNGDIRLEAAQADLVRSQQSLNEAIARNQANQNGLRDAINESNALRNEQSAILGRINQLNQQIRDTDVRIAEARSQVDSQNAVLQPLRERFAFAQRAQREIGQVAQQARSAHEAAGFALEDNRNKGRQAEAKVQSAGAAVTALQAELNVATAQKIEQQSALDSATASIAATEPEIRRFNDLGNVHEGNQGRIERERALLMRQIFPRMPAEERARIEAQIAEKTAALTEEIRLKREANLRRDELSIVLSQAKEKQQSAQRKLRDISLRIAALPAQIQSNTRERDEAVTRAARLAADRPALVSAEVETRAMAAQTQEGVTAAALEVRSAEQELRRSSSALEQAQSQLATQTQTRNRLAGELQMSQNRLSFVGPRINQLIDYQNSTRAQIGEAESRQIPFFRNQVSQNQTQVQVLTSRGQDLRNAAQPIYQDLSGRIQALSTLRQRQADESAQIEPLQVESVSLQSQLQGKQSQIEVAGSQIEGISRQISDARRGMGPIQAALPQLEANHASLQALTDRAHAEFKPADDAAKASETSTQAAARRLATVRNTYDQGISGAHVAGSTLGSRLGTRDGQTLGSVDGLALGSAFGKIAGAYQGTIEGSRKGAIDGQAAGMQAGRTAGVAGGDVEMAKARGKSEALSEVGQTERPKGFAAKSAELLAAILPAETEISMPIAQESGSEAIVLSSVDDAAEGVARQSMLVVRKFELTGSDCQRGYVEFDRICKADSLASYRASFEQAYRAAKAQGYSQGYSATHASSFEQARVSDYRKTYGSAHAQAFSQGLTEGATQAGHSAYVVARAEGKAEAMSAAVSGQNWQGRFDALTKSQNSSLVGRVKAALVMGDDGFARVSVQLTNAGAKATAEGDVKVRVKSMSNALAADDEIALIPAIAAKSKAKVLTPLIIQGRSAGVNAGVTSLQVTVYLPDGSSVVETLAFGQ